MTNKDVAKKFQLLAKILELKGEDKFKIKTYQNAYNILRNAEIDLMTADQNRLLAMAGVGKAVASKILEIQETGTFALMEAMLEDMPEGILDLLKVSGLGPKKVAFLMDEHSITSLGELWYACEENRLIDMKGFGAKSQQNLKRQLEYSLQSKGKTLLPQADAIALQVAQVLQSEEIPFDWVGEYARHCPVVSRLEVLVADSYWDTLCGNLAPSILPDGTALLRVDVGGQQGEVLCHVAPETEYDYWKTMFTGGQCISREALHEIDKGLSEAKIFEHLGLQWREPALRDLDTEVVPQGDLIVRGDIRGLIHAHSQWSDGGQKLVDMALAAQDLNMEYMVITDHSKSAFYANGLSEERIIEQHQEIDQLNERFDDFWIFKGIECDILSDGRLDYSDEVLSTFDVVIASIHSVLQMDRVTATTRLIRAIENPFTRILGHMTGRLLLSRKGYPLDMIKVIEACAQNGVAIELNSNPHRLDMDWTWIPAALDRGVLISINPDAHSIAGMSDIAYGCRVARKAGLTAADCLSSFDSKKFQSWIRR